MNLFHQKPFLGRCHKTVVAGLYLSAVLLAPHVFAAVDLGGLKVLSAQNQPFRAEVVLGELSQQELAGLKLYAQVLTSERQNLNTALEKRGNKYIIKVSSSMAMPAEKLNIAVQANIAGQVVSEKTYNLELFAPLNAQADNSNNARSSATKGLPREDLEQELTILHARPATRHVDKINTVKVDRADRKSAAALDKNAKQYDVKDGDTLYGISQKHQANLSGVNLDQVLVAIYQSNQQSFIGGNMNYLKVNSRLNLPDNETAASVNPKAARLEILAKTGQYSKYRARLSNFVAKRQAATQEANSGKVNDTPAQINIQQAERDNLKLTKANNAAKTKEENLAKQLSKEEEAAKNQQLAQIQIAQQKLQNLQGSANASSTIPAASGNAAASAALAASGNLVALAPASAPKVQGQTLPASSASTSATSASKNTETKDTNFDQAMVASSTAATSSDTQTDEQKRLDDIQNPAQASSTPPSNTQVTVPAPVVEQTQALNVQKSRYDWWPFGVLGAAFLAGSAMLIRHKMRQKTAGVRRPATSDRAKAAPVKNTSVGGNKDKAQKLDKPAKNPAGATKIFPVVSSQDDDLFARPPTLSASSFTSQNSNNSSDLDDLLAGDFNIPEQIKKSEQVNILQAAKDVMQKKNTLDDAYIPSLQAEDLLEEIEELDEQNSSLPTNTNTYTDADHAQRSTSAPMALEDVNIPESLRRASSTLQASDAAANLSESSEIPDLDIDDSFDPDFMDDVNTRATQNFVSTPQETQTTASSAAPTPEADHVDDDKGFHFTKLELAKAYLDIQDNDGARSLLEELSIQTEHKGVQQQATKLLKLLSRG